MANDSPVAIVVSETAGLGRDLEPVRTGIPFPQGRLRDASGLVLRDGAGRPTPCQYEALARWPDGSVKWLLLDALVSVAAGGELRLCLEDAVETPRQGPDLVVSEQAAALHVATGCAEFIVDRDRESLLSSALTGGLERLGTAGIFLELTDTAGRVYRGCSESVVVESAGPVRASVVISGSFRSGRRRAPIRHRVRMTFFGGSAAVGMEVGIHNPRRARHKGNLWDLGDPGSWGFANLDVRMRPSGDASSIRAYTEIGGSFLRPDGGDWRIYQDSSGGEHWDSPNHVGADGRATVTFPGYRVLSGADAAAEFDGRRATPCLTVEAAGGFVAVGIRDFWQNFPKALRWRDAHVEASLFPRECCANFELQGGEKKRHDVIFDFAARGSAEDLQRYHVPLQLRLDRDRIQSSAAVPYFRKAPDERTSTCDAYVNSIIEGETSFFVGREKIDEYGWRNFGDTYADHEAVHADAGKPFVSHYNNQYDFVYASFIHYLMSGDERWRKLMADGARHVVDIDIYDTDLDRAVFNHGLFWHTDHYREARTATHRTYSALNGTGAGSGGGPSNEHNYTSGLLHYYYLTGDSEARRAVVGLADWVIEMDDGARSMLSFLDSSSTGKASCTVSPDYHHPGRGAGNSINALLDAYGLTCQAAYLEKAEDLISRCIHPADDIDSLDLGQPEHRWSYLVFLQILARYLDSKVELGQLDRCFYYARDSFLHYAAWVSSNEVPYGDVLDRVELPTETWPAQDIRKCHVMHVAASWCGGEQRQAYSRKAGYFFDRCLSDLLEFDTAYLTRPRVILSAYGYIHAYFLERGYPRRTDRELATDHGFEFGAPQRFLPQHRIVQQLTADRWPWLNSAVRWLRRTDRVA